jgi:hypothetical protein
MSDYGDEQNEGQQNEGQQNDDDNDDNYTDKTPPGVITASNVTINMMKQWLAWAVEPAHVDYELSEDEYNNLLANRAVIAISRIHDCACNAVQYYELCGYDEHPVVHLSTVILEQAFLEKAVEEECSAEDQVTFLLVKAAYGAKAEGMDVSAMFQEDE